jgi:hypothetical protein
VVDDVLAFIADEGVIGKLCDWEVPLTLQTANESVVLGERREVTVI